MLAETIGLELTLDGVIRNSKGRFFMTHRTKRVGSGRNHLDF